MVQKLNYESEVIYKTHLKNYFTRSLIPSDLITLDHLSMSYGLTQVPFIDYELFNKVMKFSVKTFSLDLINICLEKFH